MRTLEKNIMALKNFMDLASDQKPAFLSLTWTTSKLGGKGQGQNKNNKWSLCQSLAFIPNMGSPGEGGQQGWPLGKCLYTDAGHTITIFSIYNADLRTWHLHTVTKLPVTGLRTMVSLFLIGQQTRLILTPSKVYGVLWRAGWGGGIFLSCQL